jgi:hypothetical protein
MTTLGNIRGHCDTNVVSWVHKFTGYQALTVSLCLAKFSIWIDSMNKFNSLLVERSVLIYLGVRNKSCLLGRLAFGMKVIHLTH